MTYLDTNLECLINNKKIIRKEITSFDNVRISYLFKKSKNKKSYLIFIHGLTGSFNSWRKIIPYFINKDYGIIALDLRGHFSSENYPNDYSYSACAKDINEIMKKEKIGKGVFVTHCYGSFIAFEFHKMFSKKIKALILCSSDYKHVLKSMYGINTHIFRKKIMIILKFVGKLFRKKVKYNPLKMSRTKRKYYEFRNHWQTVINMLQESFDCNYEEILKNVDVPTTIMVGKYDIIACKKRSRQMHKLIKNSKFKIIKNGEHFIITLASETVNRIVDDFIEKNGLN